MLVSSLENIDLSNVSWYFDCCCRDFGTMVRMNQSPELGVAMAFNTYLERTLQTLPARSNTETAWQAGLFANKMVWLAIVVCGGPYSITLIPGIREVFAIPATFTLGHVGLCIANGCCGSCFDGNHETDYYCRSKTSRKCLNVSIV